MRTMCNGRSWARWWALIAVMFAAGLVSGCFVGLRRDVNGATEECEFGRLFSARPFPVDLIDYGRNTMTLGAGLYVVVFRMPEEALHQFLKMEGLEATGVETDPGNWPVELVNSMLQSVLKTEVRIDRTFACYAKKTDRTSARLYYEEAQSRAVFVGRGKWPR